MKTRDLFYAALSGQLDAVEARMNARKDPAPVRVDECFACGGSGWFEVGIDAQGVGNVSRCSFCGGSGRIATEGGEV